MGKSYRDDAEGKAKQCRRDIGQVKRNYGKAGAHQDKKNLRDERNICRKKVDPSEYEEDLLDEPIQEPSDDNEGMSNDELAAFYEEEFRSLFGNDENGFWDWNEEETTKGE